MRIEVGRAEDLQRRGVERVRWGNTQIAVFATEEGFFALEDRCSHADALLSEGKVEGEVVVCPKHGARFRLRDGKAMSLPAVFPVPVFPVSVEEGKVFVEVPD